MHMRVFGLPVALLPRNLRALPLYSHTQSKGPAPERRGSFIYHRLFIIVSMPHFRGISCAIHGVLFWPYALDGV